MVERDKERDCNFLTKLTQFVFVLMHIVIINNNHGVKKNIAIGDDGKHFFLFLHSSGKRMIGGKFIDLSI